jgi:hypothetical protein
MNGIGYQSYFNKHARHDFIAGRKNYQKKRGHLWPLF